jgi:hypothetical protein
MERKLWVLYQYLLPEYRSSQTDQGTNSTAIPDDAWEGHAFVCESYNATYTLKRTYNNNVQTIEGTAGRPSLSNLPSSPIFLARSKCIRS